MFTELVADGARWAVLVVFVLASVEKVGVLRSRSSEWHPVMLVTQWRRQHARLLIILSLVMDTTAAMLLLVKPPLGLLLAASLLITYTAAAIRAHNGRDDCRCLWKMLNARTTLGLIMRNALLLGLTLLALLRMPQDGQIMPLMTASELLLVGLVTRLADRATPIGKNAFAATTIQSVVGANADESAEGEVLTYGE